MNFIKNKMLKRKTAKEKQDFDLKEAFETGIKEANKKAAVTLNEEQEFWNQENEKRKKIHEERLDRFQESLNNEKMERTRELNSIRKIYAKKERDLENRLAKAEKLSLYWRNNVDSVTKFRDQLEGLMNEYQETVHEINRKMSRLTGLKGEVKAVQVYLDKSVKKILKDQPMLLGRKNELQ